MVIIIIKIFVEYINYVIIVMQDLILHKLNTIYIVCLLKLIKESLFSLKYLFQIKIINYNCF